MTTDSLVTDEMVNRFLSWQLPQDFAPDAGVSFNPCSGQLMPRGTNLLHAGQARAMLEHVMGEIAPDTCPKSDTETDTTLATTQNKQPSDLLSLADVLNAAAPAQIAAMFVRGSDEEIEAVIQAKGLTAPRVTPADIEAAIVETYFFTAANGANEAGYRSGDDRERLSFGNSGLALLTFCVLVLKNGTKVVGINHGAINPAEHSAERGMREAYSDAKGKIWELEGYALRERLYQGIQPAQAPE